MTERAQHRAKAMLWIHDHIFHSSPSLVLDLDALLSVNQRYSRDILLSRPNNRYPFKQIPWGCQAPSHCWGNGKPLQLYAKKIPPRSSGKTSAHTAPGQISKPNNCLNAQLGCGPCRCRTHTQGTKNATSTAPPKPTDGREAEKIKYHRTIC